MFLILDGILQCATQTKSVSRRRVPAPYYRSVSPAKPSSLPLDTALLRPGMRVAVASRAARTRWRWCGFWRRAARSWVSCFTPRIFIMACADPKPMAI